MLNNFYTISSPKFPKRADFDKWALWCEWHDASELEELRSLGVSESYLDLHFLGPNSEGCEVYYPIQTSSPYCAREFTYAISNFQVGHHLDVVGFLSLVKCEVVAATIWLAKTEIDLLRNDRLCADEENSDAISALCDAFSVEPFTSLRYNSMVTDANGTRLCGDLLL